MFSQSALPEHDQLSVGKLQQLACSRADAALALAGIADAARRSLSCIVDEITVLNDKELAANTIESVPNAAG